MCKLRKKHYKHLYKFGCLFLATIILVCTFALPTFAMTIKPIEEGSAGGNIVTSIRTNLKINIYADNDYFSYYQNSNSRYYYYVYLCFDNISDIDYNDTHYGDLVAFYFSDNGNLSTEDFNGNNFYYLGDNSSVDGLLIEASVIQGISGINVGYANFNINGNNYGSLFCLRFYVPTYSVYQNECNLMLYTSEADSFNMVYDNEINLKLGTNASVPYMRMPYEWSAVNQLEYEDLFTPNLYLMEYLKGRFDITGNLAFYCYIDGNGYRFDDIADLFTYGTYPYTIQYSVDGSIGYDPPDYPDYPDDPPIVDPPDSSTSSTTPVVPTIDPNDPIGTLPSGNIPDLDDNTKNTIVLIIDHMWSGFYSTFSTLLSQTGIFGMSLLSIFAILVLILVGAFLIKLWRG